MLTQHGRQNEQGRHRGHRVIYQVLHYVKTTEAALGILGEIGSEKTRTSSYGLYSASGSPCR